MAKQRFYVTFLGNDHEINGWDQIEQSQDSERDVSQSKSVHRMFCDPQPPQALLLGGVTKVPFDLYWGRGLHDERSRRGFSL